MDSAEVLDAGLRADSISPVVPHVSVVHILSLSPLLASESICDTAVCWLASSLLAFSQARSLPIATIHESV